MLRSIIHVKIDPKRNFLISQYELFALKKLERFRKKKVKSENDLSYLH